MRELEIEISGRKDRCPYCHDTLGGETFTCTACQTTHHTKCWEENAGCTLLGCREGPKGRVAAKTMEPFCPEADSPHERTLTECFTRSALVSALALFACEGIWGDLDQHALMVVWSAVTITVAGLFECYLHIKHARREIWVLHWLDRRINDWLRPRFRIERVMMAFAAMAGITIPFFISSLDGKRYLGGACLGLVTLFGQLVWRYWRPGRDAN